MERPISGIERSRIPALLRLDFPLEGSDFGLEGGNLLVLGGLAGLGLGGGLGQLVGHLAVVDLSHHLAVQGQGEGLEGGNALDLEGLFVVDGAIVDHVAGQQGHGLLGHGNAEVGQIGLDSLGERLAGDLAGDHLDVTEIGIVGQSLEFTVADGDAVGDGDGGGVSGFHGDTSCKFNIGLEALTPGLAADGHTYPVVRTFGLPLGPT